MQDRLDRLNQFFEAEETAAPNSLLSEFAEPALD
jgi:hypothetical protein